MTGASWRLDVAEEGTESNLGPERGESGEGANMEMSKKRGAVTAILGFLLLIASVWWSAGASDVTLGTLFAALDAQLDEMKSGTGKLQCHFVGRGRKPSWNNTGATDTGGEFIHSHPGPAGGSRTGTSARAA